MLGQIVEIAEPGRHLSLHRGFMKVSLDGETLGLVPLDEILSVVVSGHGTTHSTNLLAKFAELGVGFCICGRNYTPTSMMLPVDGNVAQSKRFRLQADSKRPVRKRLWASIVRAKIAAQTTAIDRAAPGDTRNVTERLDRLRAKVRSGDPDNIEAQAARIYWPALLGSDFTRRQEEPGLNGLLNYGYAIIRSCMARAVLGAGLHPTLGLYHSNPTNPMCLVDDFMEPYRPICDCAVRGLADRGLFDVTPETKRVLANMTAMDIPGPRGVTTLFTAMCETALSYIRVMEGDAKALAFCDFPSELSFAGLHDDRS